MSNVPEMLDARWRRRISLLCAAVAGIALFLMLVMLFSEHQSNAFVRQFAFSWMFGFLFFLTISVGALFWIMVHFMTDASWSVVIRRPLEGMANLFPFLSVCFVPLILCREHLWPWMSMGVPATAMKSWFYECVIGGVHVPFYWMRTGLYLAFFTGAAWYLHGRSIRQDAHGDPQLSLRMRVWSFVFLPLFALCLTFSSIDWVMSLQAPWVSTIWGVYIFAGSAWSSMALLILIVTFLKSRNYLQVVHAEHYHIMGKWLLAFTIFWAYIAFSQYMLIWYGDISDETDYFILRNTGTWRWLNIALVIGHFFVPFLILLSRDIKRRPHALTGVASWALMMHLLDLYLIVLPNIHRDGFAPHLLDLLCPLFIGSILAVLFLAVLGRQSLFPYCDPRLQESLSLTN